jgi:hypothetical protein
MCDIGGLLSGRGMGGASEDRVHAGVMPGPNTAASAIR